MGSMPSVVVSLQGCLRVVDLQARLMELLRVLMPSFDLLRNREKVCEDFELFIDSFHYVTNACILNGYQPTERSSTAVEVIYSRFERPTSVLRKQHSRVDQKHRGRRYRRENMRALQATEEGNSYGSHMKAIWKSYVSRNKSVAKSGAARGVAGVVLCYFVQIGR